MLSKCLIQVFDKLDGFETFFWEFIVLLRPQFLGNDSVSFGAFGSGLEFVRTCLAVNGR